MAIEHDALPVDGLRSLAKIRVGVDLPAAIHAAYERARGECEEVDVELGGHRAEPTGSSRAANGRSTEKLHSEPHIDLGPASRGTRSGGALAPTPAEQHPAAATEKLAPHSEVACLLVLRESMTGVSQEETDLDSQACAPPPGAKDPHPTCLRCVSHKPADNNSSCAT